jgi:hypothetical protein
MIRPQVSALNQSHFNCEEDGNMLLRNPDNVYRITRAYCVKFQNTVLSVTFMYKSYSAHLPLESCCELL